jgi:hypothetical protein
MLGDPTGPLARDVLMAPLLCLNKANSKHVISAVMEQNGTCAQW